MDWLSAVLLGTSATVEPLSPPCVAPLGDNDFILSDSLTHIQCLLEWRAARAAAAANVDNRGGGAGSAMAEQPQEDSVVFDEVDPPAAVPLSETASNSKESVLLVLVHSPQIAESQLHNIHESLNVSALYCPKSRFPCLPYRDFEQLVTGIAEWKTTRPNGVVVYASQNAASKQLLLYLASKICLNPRVNVLQKMVEDLDVLQTRLDKALARNYSFAIRPSHPSPTISSGVLFPSQLNLLKHWSNWRQQPPDAMKSIKFRLTAISLSVTALRNNLLDTFGDEHPTLELWLAPGFALSSRPALTLKNVEANESVVSEDNTLVSCVANVQSLELLNSVVRRNENSSYHWECELDTNAADCDLMIRIFNSKAMFRLQLNAQFFRTQRIAGLANTELVLQNSEVDGYDLFSQNNGSNADKLRISLNLDIAG